MLWRAHMLWKKAQQMCEHLTETTDEKYPIPYRQGMVGENR